MSADPHYLIEALDLDGTALCIHSSMRSFNPRIEASTIIQALVDAGCTILVPTFTYFNEVIPPADDHPSVNGMEYSKPDARLKSGRQVYHPAGNELSFHDMGNFPATLLAMKERTRGDHPLNSFSAIGELADELTSGQTWEDVYAPLRKLVELDGKLLLMGTDLTSMTFIHYAEQVAGRNLFIRWARDSKSKVKRARIGSCSRAFNKLQLSLDHLRKDIHFRQSRCQLLPARQALDALVSAIVSNPGITHCKDRMCLRCSSAVKGGPQ